MGASVRAIEIDPELATSARTNLKRAGFGQVEVVTGDTFHLDLGKDYAVIAVCGALPLYDDRFARALAVGGKLFVVVGADQPQEALLVTRTADATWSSTGLFETSVDALEHAPVPNPSSSEHPWFVRSRLRSSRRGVTAEKIPLVIDVREEWELQLASIPGVLHVPMNQVPARLSELSRDAETIVMCHAGGRSMRVAHFLANQGFTNVANLTGGISAWSELVDATVPQY